MNYLRYRIAAAKARTETMNRRNANILRQCKLNASQRRHLARLERKGY